MANDINEIDLINEDIDKWSIGDNVNTILLDEYGHEMASNIQNTTYMTIYDDDDDEWF